MTVQELLKTIDNGSVHFWIINDTTGEIPFCDIWYNKMTKEQLSSIVKRLEIKNYELRIHI